MREIGLVVLLVLLGPGAAVPTFAEEQEQQKEQQGEPDRKPAPKSPQPKTARSAHAHPPSGPEPPPLRFTDFDLEKYHAPAPAEEEGSDGEEQDPAAPPRPATPPRAPKPSPALPPADPLKAFREREAKEKFRAEQLQRARDRLAGLQSRLDYLQAKRDAIQNPAPLQAGQTRAPDRTPTPIQGPGKVAIGGFFPNLPPPQTDQDKENDKKMKTRDLLALVEDEIKGLEGELEQAQDELISIQTRFAQETGVR